MTSSNPHDDRAALRSDIDPVGIWMSRGADGVSATVELLGIDGSLTTMIEHADGTIEVRTAAMTASGATVRVAPTGDVDAITR